MERRLRVGCVGFVWIGVVLKEESDYVEFGVETGVVNGSIASVVSHVHFRATFEEKLNELECATHACLV